MKSQVDTETQHLLHLLRCEWYNLHDSCTKKIKINSVGQEFLLENLHKHIVDIVCGFYVRKVHAKFKFAGRVDEAIVMNTIAQACSDQDNEALVGWQDIHVGYMNVCSWQTSLVTRHPTRDIHDFFVSIRKIWKPHNVHHM
jgi:hypothetical protein